MRGYTDARCNKRTTNSARAFEMLQETYLWDLYQALRAETWQPGRSICFVVHRPKHREVWAAPFTDRVVHHIVHNRIADRFYRAFIADSCACIPGRGTLYAARRLEDKVRSATQNWKRRAFYLKCDLDSFFPSIHKPTLRACLAHRVSEPWVMRLVDQILFHDPRDNVEVHASADELALIPPHKSLFHQPADRGLPIGNLPSQFFANVILDRLDQFVKHRLRAHHYVRYVDDFVILHESRRQLEAWRDAISAFLEAELRLRLNPRKTILQPIERGVDFVGQIVKPWRTITRRRTVNAMLQRLRTMPADEVYESANSCLGLVRQARNSHHDQVRICRALRARGHAVNHKLTKAYR